MTDHGMERPPVEYDGTIASRVTAERPDVSGDMPGHGGREGARNAEKLPIFGTLMDMFNLVLGMSAREPGPQLNRYKKLFGELFPSAGQFMDSTDVSARLLEMTEMVGMLDGIYADNVAPVIDGFRSSDDLYRFVRDYSGIDRDLDEPDEERNFKEDAWRAAFYLHNAPSRPGSLIEELRRAIEEGSFDERILNDMMQQDEPPPAIKQLMEFAEHMRGEGSQDWQNVLLARSDLVAPDVLHLIKLERDKLLKAYSVTTSAIGRDYSMIAVGRWGDYDAARTRLIHAYNSNVHRMPGVHLIPPPKVPAERGSHKRKTSQNGDPVPEITPDGCESKQSSHTVAATLYDYKGQVSSATTLEEHLNDVARHNDALRRDLEKCVVYIASRFGEGTNGHGNNGIKKWKGLSTDNKKVVLWEFKPGVASGLPANTRNVLSWRLAFVVDSDTREISVVAALDRSNLTKFEGNLR